MHNRKVRKNQNINILKMTPSVYMSNLLKKKNYKKKYIKELVSAYTGFKVHFVL